MLPSAEAPESDQLTVITVLSKREIFWGKVALYFASTPGRVLTLLGSTYLVFVAIRGLQGILPSNPMLILLGLWGPLLGPVAFGFAGINGSAVRRFLNVPLRYEFSELGLALRAPNLQATFSWSEISRGYALRDYVVLVTAGTLQIIPRRDIPERAWPALRGFIGRAGRRESESAG